MAKQTPHEPEWLTGGLVTGAHLELYLVLIRPRVFDEITRGEAQPFMGLIKTIPFGLPPLAEQAEIVRRVESMFALADAIEAHFGKARAQVERLTPALRTKAFRGQLVPQNPGDEPASELLDRLRSSTAAAQPDSKRQSRLKKSRA